MEASSDANCTVWLQRLKNPLEEVDDPDHAHVTGHSMRSGSIRCNMRA